jgi:hypothetical protein
MGKFKNGGLVWVSMGFRDLIVVIGPPNGRFYLEYALSDDSERKDASDFLRRVLRDNRSDFRGYGILIGAIRQGPESGLLAHIRGFQMNEKEWPLVDRRRDWAFGEYGPSDLSPDPNFRRLLEAEGRILRGNMTPEEYLEAPIVKSDFIIEGGQICPLRL